MQRGSGGSRWPGHLWSLGISRLCQGQGVLTMCALLATPRLIYKGRFQ
jgi:hypothetical protein